MAYLILFLAIAVAVLCLVGLRMLIGVNLSFTSAHELEQSPVAIPSAQVAKRH